MRIQHNIMAMNAYRNYNNNTSALSKNLERLSSGYKINRAGDDAAGLAISEKMRAQITGLEAAQKNVKDGISLVNTAEGAMQEVQDMLNRMVYLAQQSANGTYDNEVDRANLQKEMDQLNDEIDRIADSANFNGIKLLDGSLDADTTVKLTNGEFKVDGTGTGALPSVQTATTAAVGDGTILHKGGASNTGTTAFGLEFHDLSITGDANDTFTIKIGSNTLTGTIVGDASTTPLTGEDVAKALTGATPAKITFTVDDGTGTQVAYSKDAVNVGTGTFKAELSSSGRGVTFTQTDDATVSDVAFNVEIEAGDDAPGGTAPDVSSAPGTAGTATGSFTAGGANAATPATGAGPDLSGTGAVADVSSLAATVSVGGVTVDLTGVASDGDDVDDIIAAIQAKVDAAISAANDAGAAGTTTYTKIENATVSGTATGFSIAYDL